jgi:hypothetical protein
MGIEGVELSQTEMHNKSYITIDVFKIQCPYLEIAITKKLVY